VSGAPDPKWPEDAARAVAHEVASYAKVVALIARHPRRFAADWADGRIKALNPLAFLLNALAVLGPWRALWARVLDPNAPATPIWFELAKPAFPIVLNSMVTTLAHGGMRLLGARRPLRSSVALALYVSGGPLAIINFICSPLVLYGYLHRYEGPGMIAAATNLVLLVVFFGYLITMQAALHRISRWRVAIAVIVAWMSWAALSAWLNLHHPQIIRSILEG
jgi:hypothetical protein